MPADSRILDRRPAARQLVERALRHERQATECARRAAQLMAEGEPADLGDLKLPAFAESGYATLLALFCFRAPGETDQAPARPLSGAVRLTGPEHYTSAAQAGEVRRGIRPPPEPETPAPAPKPEPPPRRPTDIQAIRVQIGEELARFVIDGSHWLKKPKRLREAIRNRLLRQAANIEAPGLPPGRQREALAQLVKVYERAVAARPSLRHLEDLPERYGLAVQLIHLATRFADLPGDTQMFALLSETETGRCENSFGKSAKLRMEPVIE